MMSAVSEREVKLLGQASTSFGHATYVREAMEQGVQAAFT
jgi:hypothetical protein